MEKILVISDEPALAQALRDELPQYVVEAVKPSPSFPADAKLVVAEKKWAENIQATVPLLVVTRPLRLRELLYTIEARLQAQTPHPRDEITLSGGHAYSPRERMLISQDGAQRITLTEKEGELFTILLANGKEMLSREQLLKQVWGYGQDIDTHTLETHVYRLRGKLRQMEAGYDIISSEEGGYLLKIAE